MAYTNSPMVAYTKLSPNHSGQRTHSIDRITPHCVVGQCTAEGLGEWFEKTSTKASSNYGIDKDGRVGMYVEEKNRSWCSSSNANDQRAITIECASDTTEPYAFRDIVYQTLIKLCADICKRNGKTKLLWLGDKDKTLAYEPKSGEMILTVHRWFANKSCPGNWMYARMGDLAEKVTAVAKNFNRRKPSMDHWMNFSVGSSACHIAVSQIQKRNELDVELYISEDKDLFHSLFDNKDAIESDAGLTFDWRELPERKASRIVIEKSVTFGDKSQWNAQFDWIIDVMLKMKKAFKKYL